MCVLCSGYANIINEHMTSIITKVSFSQSAHKGEVRQVVIMRSYMFSDY